MTKTTILLLFMACLLLSVRLFFFYQERHIYDNGEILKETYSFNHEPKENYRGQYFFVNNILVTVPPFPKFHYGDRVSVVGKVEMAETRKGGLLIVKDPKVALVTDTSPLLTVSKFIRYRIVESVITTLPPKEAGLLLGIVLGVRDRIDNDFYVNLRNAGVLHVIAASGQNVSIAASLLLVIFDKIVKRRIAILFTAMGIVFYAFLTGFDPSIVRAAIMALIAFGALAFGRSSHALYALFATGVIMVLHEASMIENISFQMSFLSTLGILLVKPLLDGSVNLKVISVLKDDVTTTLSAQIATFPIMLASFGVYSMLTLPINTLVLWTVPILMVFGGLGAILSIFHPLLGAPFLLISYPFLSYFTFVITFFSSFHLDLIVDKVPLSLQIGYYLILFGVVIKLMRPKGGKI